MTENSFDSLNGERNFAQTPPPSIANEAEICETGTAAAPIDAQQQQEQPELQQQAYQAPHSEYQVLLEPPPMAVRVIPDPQILLQKKRDMYVRIGIAVAIIFFIFILPVMAQGGLARFGASNHKLIKKCEVKFNDVQGCDEVKGHLEKIVTFLKDPTDFQRFGAKMPRGYLLAGPPGVGKTMLAKAVAGESGVPFLTVSGAEFDEMLVGVGAARVRALFQDARAFKKAVIFIDEIDAIAGKRDSHFGSGTERQTLNQLLVEMDGFDSKTGIVVLAATNTPDSLDPAILRPGRFDKTFTLSPPDIKGRERLLKELLKAVPEDKREEGDLRKLEVMWLAKITVGYTGADLANLMNHAKMLASLDKDSKFITKAHIMEAKDFVDMGPKRHMDLTPAERERTAFHEAGHAIVSLINEGAFSVQHATIIPHGQALGLVRSVPDVDLNYMSKKMLQDRLDLCMGGFLGEKVHFNNDMMEVSTGASSDFQQANAIAAQIVGAGFGTRTKLLLPGQNASEAAKQNFEEDMKEIMDEAYERVENMLKEDTWIRAAWIGLAEALLDKSSLNRDEIIAIYNKHKPKTA